MLGWVSSWAPPLGGMLGDRSTCGCRFCGIGLPGRDELAYGYFVLPESLPPGAASVSTGARQSGIGIARTGDLKAVGPLVCGDRAERLWRSSSLHSSWVLYTQDPDPRLRLPGHPAHRAPRARGAGVLRDPPQRRQRRVHARLRRPRASSCPAATPAPTRTHELRAPQAVWELGVPVLGICYGMQTMAVQLGGRSRPAPSASSATPRCARAATRSCSTASRTSHTPKATACSRCG
jgi:hypothetical protein